MSGFIKLHRKFEQWEWRAKPNTVSLFLYLLGKASYEDCVFQGVKVPRGSLVFGRRKAAETLGLSEMQIRTALKHLKSTSEITSKTHSKFSIISITNWEKYQGSNQQDNQQITSKQPASNQQITTYKEVIEDKEVKKERESSQKSNSPRKPKKIATRLSKDWKLPLEYGEWAEEQGMSFDDVVKESHIFKDYWVGLAGSKAAKMDWFATWRNWIRRKVDFEK